MPATPNTRIPTALVLVVSLLYSRVLNKPRLFTIHVEPDKYDFERGQEYRIVKEFFKKGKKVPQSVYCYFSFE